MPEGAVDLDTEAMAAALGGRPFRTFSAVVSTEAEAMRWARQDGPDGAVVTSDVQLAARTWSGAPWDPGKDAGLGFSLLLRPRIPPIRAGRLYLAGALGLSRVLGGGDLVWPDAVVCGSGQRAAVVVRASSGAAGVAWCVVSVLVAPVSLPRTPLLATLLQVFDDCWEMTDDDLLDACRPICQALGRRVAVTLVPGGPVARRVEGRARDLSATGGLVVETEARLVTVQPSSALVVELIEGSA
ncbi:MAG: hypothetical protein ACYDAC_05150 [Candidatus Dormibacteria bacterium]